MAASKEFLEYVSDQLSEICGITYKQMMGEYIVYLNGKIAAYICLPICNPCKLSL